jgi:FkbM family methyltransferase
LKPEEEGPRINARRYRRIKHVKAAVDRLGAERLPGYHRAINAFRLWRYPELVAPASVEIEVDGIRLDVPARFVPHHLQRNYEPMTTAAFRSALRPGGTAVDIGAHIGYYTCLAARLVGRMGTVHAIEPGPDNLEFLRRNVRLNDAGNVVVHPRAAARQSGSRALHLSDSSDTHGFNVHPTAVTAGAVEVEAHPLDALVSPPVDLVKIDVEGAELEVLQGMTDLLRGSPGATVIVEWHPKCLEAAHADPTSLPRVMESVGLADFVILDDQRGTRRPLPSVLAEVERGDLPRDWYVNILGTSSQ